MKITRAKLIEKPTNCSAKVDGEKCGGRLRMDNKLKKLKCIKCGEKFNEDYESVPSLIKRLIELNDDKVLQFVLEDDGKKISKKSDALAGQELELGKNIVKIDSKGHCKFSEKKNEKINYTTMKNVVRYEDFLNEKNEDVKEIKKGEKCACEKGKEICAECEDDSNLKDKKKKEDKKNESFLGFGKKKSVETKEDESPDKYEESGKHKCKKCGATLTQSKCKYCGMVDKYMKSYEDETEETEEMGFFSSKKKKNEGVVNEYSADCAADSANGSAVTTKEKSKKLKKFADFGK